MTFPIIEIKEFDKLEQLGTKEKFWFYDQDGDLPKLFKIGRPETGENWSEKVTSELAKILGIPCASYEFAVWQGKEGVTSPSFVPLNGRLIHGNEILAKAEDSDDTTQAYTTRTYTIYSVIGVLKLLKDIVSLPIGFSGNERIKNISDLFVGYVMFDCLISNPDRHNENWGIVNDTENKSLHLAPTYDHASGLGCRVSEQECKDRMSTRDHNYSVEYFVSKTKSAFCVKDDKKNNAFKKIKTLDAFLSFSRHNIPAANFWLDELSKFEEDAVIDIFNRIPEQFIHNYSVEFACKMLWENKKRLIKSRGLINQ